MGDPASIAVGLATTAMSAKQQSSAAKAQMRARQQQADQNVKILERQQKIKEEERKRALKANLAQQRARMGASGINANVGSASALLQGISNETDRAIAQDRYQTDLQKNSMQTSLAQAQFQNLLQRKQRNRGLALDYAQRGINAGLSAYRQWKLTQQ